MSDTSDLLTIEQYSPEEFVQLTWEQYGNILEALYKNIAEYSEKNNIHFDAVVPILRGGGVVGTFLTGKLKVLRVIPVQYKYFVNQKHVYLKRLLPLPSTISLPENANILVAENCYCFGTTTKAVVSDIKTKFPTAHIYVAADRMDYTYQNIEGVEKVFYGELNNDTKKLSKEECVKLKIDETQYYYPWESLDEEIAACQLKQYKYTDLNEAEKSADLVADFDFSK